MRCENCYNTLAEMLNAKDEDFLRLKTSMERLANEAETLRAKVEVLVEALTMLLTTKEYKEVNGKDYVYDAMRITAWGMAEKALATYDKLSEVKHDTK